MGYRLTEDGFIAVDENTASPPPAQAHLSKVIDTRRPVILAEPMAATAPQDGVNETDTPASAETAILVAALTLPEKVAIGVVDFEALRDELKDEDTFKIVEAITAQAAQAIESVRLFEQTQAAREEAETLYKVGRALVTTEVETEIFNRVLQDMLATLGLKQGGILFLEPDRKFARLVALFRDSQPVEPNLRIPIAGNPSYQKLIATRQPVAESVSSTRRTPNTGCSTSGAFSPGSPSSKGRSHHSRDMPPNGLVRRATRKGAQEKQGES